MASQVSRDEAVRLCKTGDWMREGEARDRGRAALLVALQEYGQPATALPRDVEQLALHLMERILADMAEQRTVSDGPILQWNSFNERDMIFDRNSSMRVMRTQNHDIIFKVSDVAGDLFFKGFGIVVGIAIAFSTGNKLSLIQSLNNARDLVKSIIKAWEKLSDRDERVIFETVHRLNLQYVVANEDALHAGDFAHVYGRMAPTMGSIVRELDATWTEERASAVLEELRLRGVLTDNKGRWSVRL